MYDPITGKIYPSIVPDSTPADRLARSMNQSLKPLEYLKRLDELEQMAKTAEEAVKIAQDQAELAHKQAESSAKRARQSFVISIISLCIGGIGLALSSLPYLPF